jgi:hypothetical protein
MADQRHLGRAAELADQVQQSEALRRARVVELAGPAVRRAEAERRQVDADDAPARRAERAGSSNQVPLQAPVPWVRRTIGPVGGPHSWTNRRLSPTSTQRPPGGARLSIVIRSRWLRFIVA